jgi:hypothetical protein
MTTTLSRCQNHARGAEESRLRGTELPIYYADCNLAQQFSDDVRVVKVHKPRLAALHYTAK